jgi:hypothetical protein
VFVAILRLSTTATCFRLNRATAGGAGANFVTCFPWHALYYRENALVGELPVGHNLMVTLVFRHMFARKPPIYGGGGAVSKLDRTQLKLTHTHHQWGTLKSPLWCVQTSILGVRTRTHSALDAAHDCAMSSRLVGYFACCVRTGLDTACAYYAVVSDGLKRFNSPFHRNVRCRLNNLQPASLGYPF